MGELDGMDQLRPSHAEAAIARIVRPLCEDDVSDAEDIDYMAGCIAALCVDAAAQALDPTMRDVDVPDEPYAVWEHCLASPARLSRLALAVAHRIVREDGEYTLDELPRVLRRWATQIAG